MRSQVGVSARMFAALAAENVNTKVITTSEIKTSALIDSKYMELAVQALHGTFELERALGGPLPGFSCRRQPIGGL